MPLYKYKAMTVEGNKIEGTFTANSPNEVLSMIRENNYYPVLVDEVNQNRLNTSIDLTKVKTKDLAIFCRQFYTMLNAGSSIINCIDIQSKQTQNTKLKKCLVKMHEDLQKGESLSESMKKRLDIFPEILVNMVEAGEYSGNLDTIMERMAQHFEKENKINNKIKNSMMYPIILSVMSVVVVIFLMTFVMPTFVGMFTGSGVELPKPTQVLISISNFIQNKWYILIMFLGIIIISFKYIGKTEKGIKFIEGIKLSFPIIGSTNKMIIVSRFTRSMSTILASGVTLVQAYEIVSKVLGNKSVEQKMLDNKEQLLKGIPLSEVMDKVQIFPPMLISMIKIGEDSGALDEILDKTANFYDEEVETALTKMTTMIEPIMILVMAVIIGAIVIAMVLPMFDMFKTVM